MKKHLVVFDGTSSYVIPCEELEEEKRLNNVEVLFESNDQAEADKYSDDSNEEIQFGN
jgi:hypothetical protein